MDLARQLVQIVDAAAAEAVRKGGAWVVCRPGCWQCCIGTFPISQADARRLGEGLAELAARDGERAARIQERAEAFLRLEEAGAADEAACPALDPEAGTCDLYAWRPLTCRTFGPAVRWGGAGVGVCELCFEGATEEEIAACAVELDTGELEDAVEAEIEERTGVSGATTVARALR